MSELQDFVEHIQAWHEQQMGQLQIILDAPKGASIKLGDVVELTGEKAEGFRMGVVIAQQYLGKLPFTATTTAAGESDDACDVCGQEDKGQTGEHPCDACGLPIVHDEPDDLAGRNLDMVKGLQVIDTATGLPKKCAGCGTEAEHNTDCKFEYFLSYSGLHSEPDDVKAKLRQAFEAGL